MPSNRSTTKKSEKKGLLDDLKMQILADLNRVPAWDT